LKDEFLINFCAYKCKTTPFLVGILNFYAGKFEKSYLLDSPFYHIKPYQAAIQERFMARCTKDRGLVGTEDRSSGNCEAIPHGPCDPGGGGEKANGR
jgi:hypothetical protein